MKKLMATVAVAAVFSVSGCGMFFGAPAPEEQVIGVQIQDEQLVGLKDRYSTKLAVTNRLGPPTRKFQTSDGNEEWYYDVTRTFRSHPQDNVTESVVFDFGRDGIMTTHKRLMPMPPESSP